MTRFIDKIIRYRSEWNSTLKSMPEDCGVRVCAVGIFRNGGKEISVLDTLVMRDGGKWMYFDGTECEHDVAYWHPIPMLAVVSYGEWRGTDDPFVI